MSKCNIGYNTRLFSWNLCSLVSSLQATFSKFWWDWHLVYRTCPREPANARVGKIHLQSEQTNQRQMVLDCCYKIRHRDASITHASIAGQKHLILPTSRVLEFLSTRNPVVSDCFWYYQDLEVWKAYGQGAHLWRLIDKESPLPPVTILQQTAYSADLCFNNRCCKKYNIK